METETFGDEDVATEDRILSASMNKGQSNMDNEIKEVMMLSLHAAVGLLNSAF